MTRPAFTRDNVLSPEDRVASARKCLSILADAKSDDMSWKDYDFLENQRKAARYTTYAVSEKQLMYLRDLVSRFI